MRPPVYKKVLDKSLSLDGSIDTSKVTDVLLSSNIPKDTLRDIWGMANKKNPGILVEDELFVILGLVALSQVRLNSATFISIVFVCSIADGLEVEPGYLFEDSNRVMPSIRLDVLKSRATRIVFIG